MEKNISRKIMPYVLTLSMILSGCGEKSECELPSRHVHKYTKQISDDISIERYMDDERLKVYGYNWNQEYIEINKHDEEIYKIIEKRDLFDGITNWDYLYNEMATHHDYLMFYYHYTTTETYTTTDSEGNTHVKTRTKTHSGWTDNPNRAHNTGKTRLCHHRYYGYRIIYEDGKFKLEKSPLVDDIREIIYDYPYFQEDCIEEVYKEYDFNRNELDKLSPSDFDVFEGPDLSNKTIEKVKVKTKEKN